MFRVSLLHLRPSVKQAVHRTAMDGADSQQDADQNRFSMKDSIQGDYSKGPEFLTCFAVKELDLSYSNKEAPLFTICPIFR